MARIDAQNPMTSALTTLGPGNASMILFGVFFLLLFLRVPVAVALGLACLPMLLIEPNLSAMTLVQETFNAYNSFILLAVPFFLLTANLMNTGGITDRLVTLSRTMVGHFPGGLAQINVVLSIFFAGISGSSTADAASQSKIFIDAQRKEGYDDSFSVAITAVSAVLAVIIPPSILMIVWGGVLSVSIGALFLAGIIPGLLIGLVQMATVQVAQLPNLSARHPERVFSRGVHLDSGADDASDHHWRQDFWLVHRDRIGLHRGAVCRLVVGDRLSRDGYEGLVRRAARYRQASLGGAVLCWHGQRVWLVDGLLPNSKSDSG
jgi:Tripartite ATP-independent periplasmic transporter, DctM component